MKNNNRILFSLFIFLILFLCIFSGIRGCIFEYEKNELEQELREKSNQISNLKWDLAELKEVNCQYEKKWNVQMKKVIEKTEVISVSEEIMVIKVDGVEYKISFTPTYFEIITDYEMGILASIIYAENGIEPYEAQVLTAQVILNRARIRNLSIEDIIFEGNGRQFNAIHSKNFKNRVYGDEQIKAIKEAKSKCTDLDLYFFLNPHISTDIKFVEYAKKRMVYEFDRSIFCTKEIREE